MAVKPRPHLGRGTRLVAVGLLRVPPGHAEQVEFRNPVLVAVPARPDDAEPPAWPEHPRDLGDRPGGSSQCHAVDTNTASAQASGSGIASPQPARTSTSGDRSASTSRIRSSGSTATTRAARPSSALVNSPVPAARSTATSHPPGTSQSSASGGGPGRTWS